MYFQQNKFSLLVCHFTVDEGYQHYLWSLRLFALYRNRMRRTNLPRYPNAIFAISMFSFIWVNTDKGSVFFFRVQLWIMQSLDWDMNYTIIWTKCRENIEIKTGETMKRSYWNTTINITNILHCHCEHKDRLLSLLF